jgi:hypothetical protein
MHRKAAGGGAWNYVSESLHVGSGKAWTPIERRGMRASTNDDTSPSGDRFLSANPEGLAPGDSDSIYADGSLMEPSFACAEGIPALLLLVALVSEAIGQ